MGSEMCIRDRPHAAPSAERVAAEQACLAEMPAAWCVFGYWSDFPPDVARWEPWIRQHFPTEVWNALAVLACENRRGDPRIQYGGRDTYDFRRATGLFQIKPGNLWGLAPFRPGGSGRFLVELKGNESLDWAGKIEWLKVPNNNIAAAAAIWRGWPANPNSWTGSGKWACGYKATR